MTSMNFKHTYTSSDDVVATCVKRRSAYNIFNKKLDTPNESAEFARSQMLKRKGLGGTTIFITIAEEALLNASFNSNTIDNTTTAETNNNANTNTTSSSNTPSGLAYIEKCPFVYRRQTVLPLSNKF